MKTLTLAATLLVAATSVSADTYDYYGNRITDSGLIIILDAESKYDIGDVIFHEGTTEDQVFEGTRYFETNNLLAETNDANHTLELEHFDRNGNVVIGSVND